MVFGTLTSNAPTTYCNGVVTLFSRTFLGTNDCHGTNILVFLDILGENILAKCKNLLTFAKTQKLLQL